MFKGTVAFRAALLMGILPFAGPVKVVAQTSGAPVIDPVSLILKHAYTSNVTRSENPNNRQSLRTNYGRFMAPGTEAFRLKHKSGGYLVSQGDVGHALEQSELLSLSIPSNQSDANKLKSAIIKTYGPASISNDGEQVWHVANSNRGKDQPKIITIKLRNDGRDQILTVDRMMIGKRGRLVETPQRQASRSLKTRQGNSDQALGRKTSVSRVNSADEKRNKF